MLLAKKRVDDMTTVKLAYGYEVHGSNKKSEPTYAKHWIMIDFGQWRNKLLGRIRKNRRKTTVNYCVSERKRNAAGFVR